jgi:hypothetical protein
MLVDRQIVAEVQFLQREVITHGFQSLGQAAGGVLPRAQSGAPTVGGKIARQSRWIDHLSHKQKGDAAPTLRRPFDETICD